MDDRTISLKAAIDGKISVELANGVEIYSEDVVPVEYLKALPPAQQELFGNSEQLDCSDCVNHGGDWDCDHVHCRKGTDTISRAAAIDVIEAGRLTKLIDAETAVNGLKALPSAQPEITYQTCSDALLKIWIDNVLTDGEYNRIMDRLNAWKGAQT